MAELRLDSANSLLQGSPLPSNMATEVYDELRRAIVEGVIRPNERLIESELALRLNVSRTPIRESMLRLAGDGLIVGRRRGWVVREHSPQEIREVFEIRAALEGYAARLAAERATDDELARLQSIHRATIDSLESADRSQLLASNEEFHEFVISTAGNGLLAEQIHRNSQHYFIHRIAGFLSDDEVRASISGHEELVTALVSREADRAERVARDRVIESLQKTLAKLA
jgi:DNA-binding GntR family transcriptional regulator